MTSCGIWECCEFNRPTQRTRDLLEDLLHRAAPRAARELRRVVRQGDHRIAGDTDGAWWRDPLRWQS